MKRLIALASVLIPFLSSGQIIYGSSTNTQYHQFLRDGNGTTVYINQVSSDASRPILRLSSGTADPNVNVRFSVENNGYVGIGTTSPESKLHLYSNLSQTNKIFVESTMTGQVGIDFKNANNHARVITDSRLFRIYDQNAATDRLTIDSDGNVGINQSAPSARLHVFKNATTGSWGNNTLTNAGIRIQDSGASLYIDGNTLYSDALMNIGTVTNNFMTFGTNDTERLRILSNGNVGIGTTTTGSHKLAVEGSIGAREVKVYTGT